MNRKAKALEFVNEGYNIQITGRHIQITESMKDYALEKISKIERFINRIIDVVVIMDIQKLNHRVEIILQAGNFKITSQAVSTDMYASIDKAVTRLETRLLRYKSKIQDHHAKGLAAVDMVVNVIRRPFDDEDDLDEEYFDGYEEPTETESPEVVTQETMALKTLTPEEALMKIELSRDAFLVYKDEQDQKLKVIYRRRNGDYGIIEPQG